ncbi:nuclear speckle splicing regulatory protein 1 isoform X1 [Saccopteryx leptura]|uniref:nuclear speckle splicing regulatory protein 1 isoform X1 n=2 Tax=Saccopteryx leptura TaxID=249018 RepID=UPI00339C2ECA
MAIPGRQYGLILPKKAQQLLPVLQKPSVFGNDSDDDEASVSESLQREAAKKQAMKQTKLEIQKALAEDSTVYEYDSIYDEMQKKKEESNPKLLLGKDRKPKYIHNLLKAVEIRKKEQEKRMEKKIQREREMEKGEFDDKEAFVTSAYKKKLQERAEEEEREKRAAALEARLDVTKQKDLSGFYRHLLNQAVGEEEIPTCSFREARSGIKEEKSRGYSDEVSSENRLPHEKCILQTVVKEEENPDADSDIDADSSEDDEMEENKVNCRREKNIETSENHSRHHRNRAHSRSSSEEREQKAHTRSSKSRGHEKREDQHQDRQRRDQESYYTDRDYRKEKDSHRHREISHRDSHWKRHEQEDKLRGRDQRERNDREWKREKNREKYPTREQEKDRQQNDHNRHREKGAEKEEKSKEKEEHTKTRKERYENRDREKQEVSVHSSERKQDRKESSPDSGAKDRFLDQERSDKMRTMEKDKERNSEKLTSSETSLGAKQRITDECQETGKEERPHEAVNKFAKRSNEETVMSARDRYLARQMARVNAKTYIEKEED